MVTATLTVKASPNQVHLEKVKTVQMMLKPADKMKLKQRPKPTSSKKKKAKIFEDYGQEIQFVD
jgi:hypothetical protein